MRLRAGVLLVVLASCRGAPERVGFRLRIATVGDLTPLGPLTDSSWSMAAQDWVFQPVARAAGGAGGQLARSVERLNEKAVRVQLDPAATFSDGSPASAEVVASALRSAGLEVAVRDGSLEVSARGGSPVDGLLAGTLISRTSSAGPVGTGPFVVVEQGPAHLVLRRREPRPNHILEVEMTGYPTSRDAFAHVLRGEADALIDVDPRLAELFDGVKRLRLISAPGIHQLAVLFNSERFSARERVGLVGALSAPAIAEFAYGSHCPASSAAVATGRPPSGRPLQVMAVDDSQSDRAGLAVVRALGSRAGELVRVQARVAQERSFAHDYDITIGRLLMSPPSMLARWFHSGAPLNFTAYSNRDVDAALDRRDWAAARNALERDPPGVFICRPDRLAVVDVRVKTPRLGPYGYLETLPDWEVSP